jgi:hypothetical protein
MPAPTLAEFKALFPEFEAAGVTDPTMQTWIDFSDAWLDEQSWGECYKSAVSYDAAHRLVMSQARADIIANGGVSAGVGGSRGQVSSGTGDGLSIGFNVVPATTNTEEWYKSTGYGQEFLVLRASCLTGAYVTGSTPTLYFANN